MSVFSPLDVPCHSNSFFMGIKSPFVSVPCQIAKTEYAIFFAHLCPFLVSGFFLVLHTTRAILDFSPASFQSPMLQPTPTMDVRFFLFPPPVFLCIHPPETLIGKMPTLLRALPLPSPAAVSQRAGVFCSLFFSLKENLV